LTFRPGARISLGMDNSTRNAAIAAACIMLGFGLVAYFMPTIMLAVGQYSTAAGAIAVAFVAAFFLIFWLRGRVGSRNDHGK
jgi:hypothetical protein